MVSRRSLLAGVLGALGGTWLGRWAGLAPASEFRRLVAMAPRAWRRRVVRLPAPLVEFGQRERPLPTWYGGHEGQPGVDAIPATFSNPDPNDAGTTAPFHQTTTCIHYDPDHPCLRSAHEGTPERAYFERRRGAHHTQVHNEQPGARWAMPCDACVIERLEAGDLRPDQVWVHLHTPEELRFLGYSDEEWHSGAADWIELHDMNRRELLAAAGLTLASGAASKLLGALVPELDAHEAYTLWLASGPCDEEAYEASGDDGCREAIGRLAERGLLERIDVPAEHQERMGCTTTWIATADGLRALARSGFSDRQAA